MNLRLLERAIFEYALYHNRTAGTFERVQMAAWAKRMARAIHQNFALNVVAIDKIDTEDGGCTTDLPPNRRWDEEWQEDDEC